jgi:hypothetical protein
VKILIENNQLENFGKQIIQYWPLVILLGTGFSLSFQAGYFLYPLGLSFYHVSVEDLSKTGLIISILASSIYGFTPMLNALPLVDSKYLKVLLIAVGLLIFLGSSALNLFKIWDTSDVAAIWSATAFFACQAFGVFLLLGLFLVSKQKSRLLNFDSLALTYLIINVMCFLFGLKQFNDDIHQTKDIVLSQNTGQQLTGYFVTERSYFYLLFDPETCGFHVVQKSNWQTSSFSSPLGLSSRLLKTNSCLSKFTPYGELK